MPVEEIKGPTCNMQNLVALPMKFSFLEGKLHGWVFSAGTSGVKAACWCWQCWARQPRQALRGAVLGRSQPLPRVPGSACARPLANSLRGGLKINTWACWAAFLAKINTASLPAPRELGHTSALWGHLLTRLASAIRVTPRGELGGRVGAKSPR